MVSAVLLAAAVLADVSVFSKGEAGYYCIKIPDLMQTAKGTLLAFGEARKGSCSDYTSTDLVYKRSVDGGQSWSDLKVLWADKTPGGANTVGQAVPVQLRENGRILVPFNRNNSDAFITHSDDDGVTFTQPKTIPGMRQSGWDWIGFGPPSAIQLRSGRVLIPAYHSPHPNDNGLLSHGHTVLSDDGGETWRLGATIFGSGHHHSNECQAAELKNGSILINARGLLSHRLQTRSDDGGETFGPVTEVPVLREPLSGCEGSLIALPGTDTLFWSGVMGDKETRVFRQNMTVWRSDDAGAAWSLHQVLEPSFAAYSAMTHLQNGSVAILYEQSDTRALVFVPDRQIFTVFEP